MAKTLRAKTLRKEKQISGPLLCMLLGMAGALAIFLPFLIVDKGFFLYCGDYNSQQIPFYTYLQQFIKDGGGTWSWATDLGSSAVSSYSFYNLGSPFFWLTMPFPSRWMPFLMVPLFMLKFGAIGATACLFLQRYAKNRNMAVVCSMVFTFCGFNVYNIFFNHMLEPVCIFCFMMYAMDAFIYDGKRGLFAISVGLSLLNSYFFFIGNVVFLVLYFVVKLLTDEYVLTMKTFGVLVFEAVLGVGIGMVLALPAYYNLIGNPRTDNFASGLNLILYWHVHQIPNILSSMFVPPDPPYLPNVFTEGAIKWSSMSAFLPVVGMSGVAAYFASRSWRTSTKALLGISLLMALVPVLNSSFYAFNASYYARWFYMPLLIACQATLRALEDEDIKLDFGIKFVLVVTGAYGILGLLPNQKDGQRVFGVADKPGRFWLTWLTAMFGILLFAFIVRFFRGKARFGPLLLGAVMGFSAFYAVSHISQGKFRQWEADANYRAQQYDGSAQLQLPQGQFYRIDTYGTYDNLGLWLNRNSIQCFNSVVTPSIMEFYPMVGVKRDVSSKPEVKHFALRGLLSVQYTVVPTEKRADFENEHLGSLGWRYVKEEGPFTVFENENFLPLGFTYDAFIPLETLRNLPEDDRAPILMRAIGLEKEEMEQYGHLFAAQQGTDYHTASYASYVEDVAARRATAAYDSTADASGFTARIHMNRENLVFFAVPYDTGFTATVNGKAADVLKVSGGLMAVHAPAGDNEIVFTYRTPGLHVGAVVSFGSLAVLAVYLLLVRRRRRNAAVPARILAAKGTAPANTAAPDPNNEPYATPTLLVGDVSMDAGAQAEGEVKNEKPAGSKARSTKNKAATDERKPEE